MRLAAAKVRPSVFQHALQNALQLSMPAGVQVLEGLPAASKRAVVKFITGAGRQPPADTQVLRVGLASGPSQHCHPEGLLGRLPQVGASWSAHHGPCTLHAAAHNVGLAPCAAADHRPACLPCQKARLHMISHSGLRACFSSYHMSANSCVLLLSRAGSRCEQHCSHVFAGTHMRQHAGAPGLLLSAGRHPRHQPAAFLRLQDHQPCVHVCQCGCPRACHPVTDTCIGRVVLLAWALTPLSLSGCWAAGHSAWPWHSSRTERQHQAVLHAPVQVCATPMH